jgi:uncharacterized protein YjbI with pentapeptide repeats
VPTYDFEVSISSDRAPETGVIEANDETGARRLLIQRFGLADHNDVIVSDQADDSKSLTARRAFTMRFVLQSLSEHHHWLSNVETGRRAELRGMDLSGLSLAKKPLQMVCFSGADLRGADLSGANMEGVDLSGADLADADLSQANLSKADLSDSDMRGANLSGTVFDGADLWRANLRDSKIEPELLHRIMGCYPPDA